MGTGFLLLKAVLFLAQVDWTAGSQYCGRLEYWNPDSLCCGSCLQRFGPPLCPGLEFAENCGLNDFGDHVTSPFKECAPGQCNPHHAELCHPCGGAQVSGLGLGLAGRGKTQRCKEVYSNLGPCFQRPVPTKRPCPQTSRTTAQHFGSASASTFTKVSASTSPSSGLPLTSLLASLITAAAVLLLTLSLCYWRRRHGDKVVLQSCPALVCKNLDTHTPTSSLRSLEAPVCQLSVLDRELPGLASKPLSRLLDELEVLEELVVLLDPEPGPGGACGTTRHLAARYGLPATWSTFAYSLRPSQSPLRALIEVVVAREPSASLGQFGTHLAQLGRADALQVLSKLS